VGLSVKLFKWTKKDDEAFSGLASSDVRGMWIRLRTSKAIHDGIGGGALITGILFLTHYFGSYWPSGTAMFLLCLIASAFGVVVGAARSKYELRVVLSNSSSGNAAPIARLLLELKHDFNSSARLAGIWLFFLWFYWKWYGPQGAWFETLRRVAHMRQ